MMKDSFMLLRKLSPHPSCIGFSLFFFIVFLSASLLPAKDDTKKQQVRLEFQFLRVLGSLSGDTAIDENLWTGEKQPEAESAEALTFFTSAHFQIGENRLEISPKGWLCDGKPIPLSSDGSASSSLPEKRISLINGPSFLVESGERPSMVIGSNGDVEYMEKRGDGAFDLKKIPNPTDLTMDIQPVILPNGRIHLSDLSISLCLVERREPVAGTSLPVGRPVFQEMKFHADISVASGKDYGVILHPKDGQGILILRLRASKI